MPKNKLLNPAKGDPLTRNQERGGWNPNDVEFEDGQKFFVKALKAAGLHEPKRVFTSRDTAARRATKLLQTSNVPPGFKKWQLPFSLYKPSNAYITVGEPLAKVRPHNHIHGAGFRLIIEGSITLNGEQQLTSGDWFFVPQGIPYSYEVGPRGVTLYASYEC